MPGAAAVRLLAGRPALGRRGPRLRGHLPGRCLPERGRRPRASTVFRTFAPPRGQIRNCSGSVPLVPEELRVLALFLQRLSDHSEGHALGVALAGQHAREAAQPLVAVGPRVDRSLRSTSSRAVVSSCSESSWETASSISVESMPLVRSSWESARRARPRPRCRDSTQASANAPSLMSPTSSNRDSTSSATSSGISRLRRASASCLRVRGFPVSRRRQIPRARSAGSAGGSSFSALDEEKSPRPLRTTRRSHGHGARVYRARRHRAPKTLSSRPGHALHGYGLSPGRTRRHQRTRRRANCRRAPSS